MKDRKKLSEISRWKVENSDGFQAVDPMETSEETETAECCNIEEEAHDGAHNQNKTDEGKTTAKSKVLGDELETNPLFYKWGYSMACRIKLGVKAC